MICKGKELPTAQFEANFPELPFEECNIASYIKDFLCCGHSNYDLFDFINSEYDELAGENKPKWKERTEAIDALVGNTNVYFDIEDETDEEYD